MPRVNVRNTPRLKQEIQKAGLDVLLVFSMENILYLSGALFALKNNLRGRLASAGFTKDGFDFLVGVTNELSVVREQAHEIRGYVEFKGTVPEIIVQILFEQGLEHAVIGLEKRFIPISVCEELQVHLPGARFESGCLALEIARAIKIPAHIEQIGFTSRATEPALARSFTMSRAGETEKKGATRLISEILNEGADVVRHNVYTVGNNAYHAHRFPSAETIL